MAANLSHEPGPLGSQESQHELQEPQEISDSNDNDPNEPENKISWYIVEDGPYSMCIMGFNPEEADDFENDAAEDRTTFYLIGQGPCAKQQAGALADQVESGRK